MPRARKKKEIKKSDHKKMAAQDGSLIDFEKMITDIVLTLPEGVSSINKIAQLREWVRLLGVMAPAEVRLRFENHLDLQLMRRLLRQEGLLRHAGSLEAQDVTSPDMLLGLTEDDLRLISDITIGARKKIRIACTRLRERQDAIDPIANVV